MTAAILPTWFDWCSLGICSAWFLGSSWPNQTPLLQHAFFLPLFIQAPSVYTVTSSHCRVGPWCLYRHARWVESLLGSVKILKHSAKLSLQVIDGLKLIIPSSCLTLLFPSFRVLVRDIPSGGSCAVGLCLGGIRLSLVMASVAHLCGFLHPQVLSFTHSRHTQFLFFWWVGCCAGWQSHADILIRLATLIMLCFCRRHFALELFMGFCTAERWYHAGSCAKR